MARDRILALCLALALPCAVGVGAAEGRSLAWDKDKPVRRALERQYARLAEAVQNRDFAAFQALHTADFHTVDEHGKPLTPESTAARARAMMESIEPPIRVSHTIATMDLREDEAKVTVRRYVSKRQTLGRAPRRVETYVTQDETWVKTSDGWKLRVMEGVRDAETYVDGKRIEPEPPTLVRR
jgi:hypothetical protein